MASPQLVDAPLSYFHSWVGAPRRRQRAVRDVMQCSVFCLERIIYSANLRSFPYQSAEKWVGVGTSGRDSEKSAAGFVAPLSK